MSENFKEKVFTEVWGDRVDLKELVISCVIGVVLTMTMFLIGQRIFLGMETIETSLANGYALLVGVAGCLLAGFISARLFKPKRVVEEQFEFEDIEAVLHAAGISVEEEIQALSTADADIIQELEDLELYGLLALIPESSPNYKKEYREKTGERV